MPVLVLFSAQAIGMAVIIGYGFASMKGTWEGRHDPRYALTRAGFPPSAVHEPEPGFRACALLGVPPLML